MSGRHRPSIGPVNDDDANQESAQDKGIKQRKPSHPTDKRLPAGNETRPMHCVGFINLGLHQRRLVGNAR